MIQGRIDPHVHCRDGRQSYKSTIERIFQIADEQEVWMIFDMPNTNPPITTRGDVKERLKLVPPSCKDRYRLYVGITSDSEQIVEAVKCHQEFEEVIGLKMFAGSSVGNLLVAFRRGQRMVYKTLSDLGYEGVLATHCVKESFLRTALWDPSNPITHCLARPEEAEIKSVQDQIRLAREEKFKGTVHICHITCMYSIDAVICAKEAIRITCGVTPHHIMWDNSKMNGEGGLIFKMNPPLRRHSTVISLRHSLINGCIDWIETDHAPHAVDEKLFPPYLSGFPSLALYRYFVEEWLSRYGLSQSRIDELTRTNIIRTFSDKLT